MMYDAWRGVRRIVAGASEPDSVTQRNGAG